MAQVGRISGPLLQANLLRQGAVNPASQANLTFRNTSSDTELLFLNVNDGKVSVNHSAPTNELHTSGTTRTTNLIVDTSASFSNFEISSNDINILSGDINLNAPEAIVLSNFETDNIHITDNVISTYRSNAGIDLTPHGTGTVEVQSDLNVFGNLYTPQNLTFDGNITFGDQDTDDVVFNADINTDIIPDLNQTYGLGSATKKWQTINTLLVNGESITASGVFIGGDELNSRQGNIFYVAENGDDTNVGDHPQGPFKTIKRALDAADSSAGGPVTIHVYPGGYEEELPLVVPSNVSIIGADMRNTFIRPESAYQSEDIFHLNDETTIQNLTITNFYYNSGGNTGYAFRYAPNAILNDRSPYIQNVTVLTNETNVGDGDAGRGAWIDGAELNSSSTRATMLFHSCTFISPNADVINMTNGVRVEWLNSFTYYANRGLYAFNGVTGRTSLDGSTMIYGAEVRSIGSANVYGTYGAVADGNDTLMYLIQHNFAYIGTGNDNTNELDSVVQANEVVELNDGQIHYVSTDQVGNFRVGDNFFVNLETGDTSISIDTADIDTLNGLIINTPGGTSVIDGGYITTGNINISNNKILTTIGDLNLEGATGTININDNTNISGNLDIVDNFSFGGSLNIAGDQPGINTSNDRLVFNVDLTQDFNPHVTLTHDLGQAIRPWSNAHLDRAEIDDITIDENYITTDVSNANLDLRANGTSNIYIPSNNFSITNNLTVDGTTDFQAVAFEGLFNSVGAFNQTGNRTATNFTITENIDVPRSAQFEEILVDDNYITTTTSNADLELRAAATGNILIPNNNVNIVNNLSVTQDIDSDNLTVIQTTSGTFNTGQLEIAGNSITTTAVDTDLILRANSIGRVLSESSVQISNDLTVSGDTKFEDSFTGRFFGPELVVNGTFDTNLNGWTQTGSGSASVVNGNLQIDATSVARNVSQEITVEVGKTYDFEATFRSVSNSNAFYLRIFESGVGILQEWNETSGLTNNQDLTFSFTAQTTAVDIIFRAVDTVVEWDNVSMFEDEGIKTVFTPVQVNLTGTNTQTGNTVQIGNITQTGTTTVSGTLIGSADFTSTVFNFNNDVISNTQEGLRASTEISDPNSLPQIVNAIVGGSTANDYPNQTEKNLINFLNDNDLIDVNRSGTTTTSDFIAWSQYIQNGETTDNLYDDFLKAAVKQITDQEFSSPGYFNEILFDGDYNNPNFELHANGTGKVLIPNNNVDVSNDIFTAEIIANDIAVNQDLEINEIVITDSLIEIDDNFIATTVSNANLEVRAQENKTIYVPNNNATIEQNLTVSGNTNINDVVITGSLTHTGTRNQTGNLNVIGNVYASTSNIESEIQFDDISFDDNVIATNESNADLELRANGTGIINIFDNDVQINNDVSLGTLTAKNVDVNASLTIEELQASSNIKIFDNVISTTESNSNLELRTSDNSNIDLQNIIVNNSTISTASDDVNLDVSGNLNINATGALKVPTGTTTERQTPDSAFRFNTTNSVFEAFNNTNVITFNGVYSDNRATSLLAHPTNNTITAKIIGTDVVTVDNTGISAHGLDVDDILINNNSISTTVSNSPLELRANGTGSLIIDNISINTATITNTVDSALELNNTFYGKIKFAGTGSVRIPAGTDAERPPTVETGMTRWNTEEELLEVWDGSTFITAAGTSSTLSAADMDDLVLEYTLIFG